MLRVHTIRSAVQAKSYYSRSDYYTEDQELPGLWHGKGAARLGLDGVVQKEAFDALCDNLHPVTGERVTARTDTDRTIGYDFNFNAPKSLTLLHALTNNTRLLSAFQQSVDETMRLIESDAQTRVRGSGRDHDRSTGELTWARFDHFTARPIGGIPDPHLHSHCVVFNMTFDPVESRWKAGQFRNLKRDAPFYQSVFHAKLTARLQEMGLPLTKTADGWEIDGFKRATLEKFSRRTQQIEKIAEDHGIVDPETKAEIGGKNRELKAKSFKMSELRENWYSRLDADEATFLASFQHPAPSQEITTEKQVKPVAGLTVKESLDFACRHLLERNSVVSERRLLAEMLSVGLGRFDLNDAKQAIAESDLIVREVKGQRMATMQGVLAEEQAIIDFARDGRGQCDTLGAGTHMFHRDWLNADQQAAVKHLLGSRDRVMMIRGSAGAGKTTLMQEAVEAIEAGGHRVFTFAPSADASRGVLRQEGFENAETVARLLVDEELQASTRGQVLWIDEAGLLGSKQMKQVFDIAERLACRVILSGDRKQHHSVERGSVLGMLIEEAGVKVAELKEIQRQKGEYRDAVRFLAEGRTEAGFDRLDALGWVKEIDDDHRYQHLAADYVATIQEGKSALVVSPTHAEGERVTATIRDTLREVGKLKGVDHEVSVLTRVDLTEAQRGEAGSYRPGDVLQFHQNAKGGIRMGDRIAVEEGRPLPVSQAAKFQVYRPATLKFAVGDRIRITKGGETKDGHKLMNGALFDISGFTKRGDIKLANGWTLDRNFGHVMHGYVATSHASQGKTVDRVFIGQSSMSWGAASREQFYVSASRGRQKVTVYTDDKASLRDAVARSDERLTATELLAQSRTGFIRRRVELYKNLVRGNSRPRGLELTPSHLREVLRD